MPSDRLKEDGGRAGHPLGSGAPCRSHGCHDCCLGTRMLLTKSDIERIVGLGHRFRDFVAKRGGGRYLRNERGMCVFLGEGGCRIYHSRPEGCRIYPLVYDGRSGRAGLHDRCLFGSEFIFDAGDVKELTSILRGGRREGRGREGQRGDGKSHCRPSERAKL